MVCYGFVMGEIMVVIVICIVELLNKKCIIEDIIEVVLNVKLIV